MPLQKTSKKPLTTVSSERKTLEKNCQVVKKDANGVNEVIKQGFPVENHQKHFDFPSGCPVIGVAKGCTVNMGDFQSLRIDSWLSRPLAENETPEEALMSIAETLSSFLEEEVDKHSD